MKKVFICLLSFTFISLLYGYTDKQSMPASKSVLCETDNIEILRQVVDPAKDEYDIDVVALWLRDKNSGKETKLLQTTRPDWRYWHMSDSKNFYPVSYDSLFVASRAYIYNSNPLQIIVEGSPDFRNEFSYFIDIANKKARQIPADGGYMGSTEEGYMVFRSYRYVSDPDIAGRYTLLQVFDENGVLVDSLDLEHVILQKYRDNEM